MIKREDVYKIGRLGKAHGVKGEVSFQFDDDIFDTTDADYLILEIDGILVPFFMEEYRFRNDSLALVKFCDVSNSKVVGKIAAIDDTTQNILFELEDGRLIPASDELITNIDTNRQQIIMQIPTGLLEI